MTLLLRPLPWMFGVTRLPTFSRARLTTLELLWARTVNSPVMATPVETPENVMPPLNWAAGQEPGKPKKKKKEETRGGREWWWW